jgi:type IV pilus assembly protein PilP
MRAAMMALIVTFAPLAFVYAQAPASAPAPAQDAAAPVPEQTPPASTPAPAPPAPPENYTYDPAGRRDPFLSLLSTGAEPRPATGPEGPAGLTTAEVSVRGILQSRGTLIAMIKGPDNKTYLVRQGDKLLDGTIKSITPQGLVILQQVNDPLSLVKEREVRKMLREDGKA